MILLLIFYTWAVEPVFNDSEINKFIEQIKQQKKIPDPAIDIIFDFYKKNRKTSGGLKDISCIDKNEYSIRYQDPKMTKSYLKEGIENENCLCVIDYTQSQTRERGHCLFLEKNKTPVIENFYVAHGKGSKQADGRPTTFTNSLKSTGTTLTGLFLTAKELYKFQGKALGVYTSTGLGLYGVEATNWTAATVGKVTHGAPYVVDTPGKVNVGNSLGCPAMPMEKAKMLLPRCKGKATWLNYTDELLDKKNHIPLSCSNKPKGYKTKI